MIAVASLATVPPPAWHRNTQGDTEAGLEAGTPGIYVQQLPDSQQPRTAGPARVGFPGLRQNLARIVSSFIPNIPRGPARVIAARPTAHRPGQPATMPIRAAVIPSALVGVEQTAPWYEYGYLQ